MSVPSLQRNFGPFSCHVEKYSTRPPTRPSRSILEETVVISEGTKDWVLRPLRGQDPPSPSLLMLEDLTGDKFSIHQTFVERSVLGYDSQTRLREGPKSRNFHHGGIECRPCRRSWKSLFRNTRDGERVVTLHLHLH